MKQKGIIYVLPLLALLLIVAVGSYYYLNKNKIPDIQLPIISSPSPSPVAIPSTENWKTYKNDLYAFELNYPADWKITGTIIEGIVNLESGFKSRNLFEGLPGPDERVRYSVLVSAIDNPKEDDALDVIYKYYGITEDFEKQNIKFERLQINNQTVYKSQNIPDMYGALSYFFESADKNTYIGLTLWPYDFKNEDKTQDEPVALFNQIISSFKFAEADYPLGKPCGGFAGETGQLACPGGYYCQYPKPRHPDEQGKCIKK
ncbi:MAG: hypothetical protein A3D24_04980 [Candidatus Blackburnbacteria bacterium RIFCSPHIGHO2_02_FULL_39_13]|uniref:Uncharacterized protein n=1 Tax=Candidatus Blackburnbacteria bacterium RIFCSPLOWO2_01_FULL_40_20 TaxID=1797519 RepID=A0A1G1VB29_9BACT|nr:MAG: hypothetical protein UT38_C0022G0007 [Microgenomates group bacterium GW2011_GWA2_39_19]OGY07138.1 MAG: hypothetical protein A2694_03650 [Candidatus Blackburnbacteria bacterium RIFCSPHIGHO2_01_FULL_40_17]OGY08960.1 MAG: hypothetical protein A3D24_04980 [Candidatus Blackburnbacteria bacterium RIFCSPHIGHO2_02_FULL_39_13]OGY12694.1 MAG: hypothetical protein A3A77_00165 [Candidatus Blackburnbacteria bacterium RIFCSPLOWO2_01_FULL_40_20]OGY15656.1 MAG: hypothetical protein A3I52_02970 [Candida